MGVYNGAGYHSIEKNGNKALEWRVSLRPLGWIHPNLQLTYFGVWGKGNVEQGNSIPTWHHHAVMVSYEHQYVVLTGQFMMGQGIQKGEGQLWIGLDGQPAKYNGGGRIDPVFIRLEDSCSHGSFSFRRRDGACLGRKVAAAC